MRFVLETKNGKVISIFTDCVKAWAAYQLVDTRGHRIRVEA